MECTEFLRNSDKHGVLTSLSRNCVKLTRIRTLHAGLVACFVPLVICDSGWSRRLHHLSFDEIYNETSYAQLQHHTRPYDLPEPYSYIPPRSHHISTYSQQVPTHSQNITTHYEDIPTHSQNIATYSQNVPSHSQNTATHYLTVPKPTQVRFLPNFDTDSHSLEDLKGNELEFEDDLLSPSDVKAPLLVGFSHDPYRYSVPEEDYLKGVRNMNPKSILSKGENRGKRGVLHLYNMMYCATGCEPLAYKGYGCYCGFLGSGRPTDGIDRCCKMHDECYENIYCPFFTVYFQPYYWKCYKGQPLCALENRHTEHQFINGCAAKLCECDRKFAMCVKRYPCPRRRALCRSSPIRLLQNLLMFR